VFDIRPVPLFSYDTSSSKKRARFVVISNLRCDSNDGDLDSDKEKFLLLLDRAVRRINRYIKPDFVLIYWHRFENDNKHTPQFHQIYESIRDIAAKLECLSLISPATQSLFELLPPAYKRDIGEKAFDDVAILDDRVTIKSSELSILLCDLAYNKECVFRVECRPALNPNVPCVNYEDLVTPSICEPPFQFGLIEVEDNDIRFYRQTLAMPFELGLVDCHIHTQFGYCAENMDAEKSLRLAREFGLAGVGLVEHSGQIYFDEKTFWEPAFLDEGINTKVGLRNRAPIFFSTLASYRNEALIGMEIDCDYAGNPVIMPSDIARCDIKLGAIHWLKEMMQVTPDYQAASEEFLFRLERFLSSGVIDVLAHPFRLFENWSEGVPDNVFKETIRLLAKYDVAAELNFHRGDQDERFVFECLNAGVKLTLGSDSHNLSQIGDLYPHIELLKRCGISDHMLSSVLADCSIKDR